jgi:Tol biopolymer transport system component
MSAHGSFAIGTALGSRDRISTLMRVSVLALGADAASAQVCNVHRASVDVQGNEVPFWSMGTSVTYDGRYVSFSTMSSLMPADTNGTAFDVYLLDLQTNTLELISVALGGASGNLDSHSPGFLSADGRYVAFTSSASDLVPGDTNDTDAFVRDRWLGVTTLVSQTLTGGNGEGTGAARMSQDGRYVLFSSRKKMAYYDTNAILCDLFLRDLQTGALECISLTPTGVTGFGPGESGIGHPCGISADNRYVVFTSGAKNLTNTVNTSGLNQVFRRDRTTGTTIALSVDAGGQFGNHVSQWPTCSEDGRWVAFASAASNLVPGDTNGADDIFVCDTVTGSMEIVSVDWLGHESDWPSYLSAISPCGRFVSFTSAASDLIPNDLNGYDDSFLRDRLTGRTIRIHQPTFGEPDQASTWASVSRDAGTIAFASRASNVVPNDTNNMWDVFVRRCPLPESYCTAKVNSQGCTPEIGSSGIPMAVTPSGFVVRATQVLNQKSGMLFYSTAGAASVPFKGGTLCLQAPLRRTSAQLSGGSPAGSDCTGSYAFDFNAWIATGLDPSLGAGVGVWAQFWARDPGFLPPDSSCLTDATRFVIWP